MGGKKTADRRKAKRAAEASASAATDAKAAAAVPAGQVATQFVSLNPSAAAAAPAPAAAAASKTAPKAAAAAAAADEDDKPELSSHALAALSEFYAEKKASEQALKAAAAKIAANKSDEANVSIDLFTEDYGLSQFWYSVETIDHLVGAALAAAGPNGSIACISTPSLYAAMKKRCGPQNTVYLLEFDQRFKAYSGFVYYDYSTPLNVKLPKHSIDVCVVDPPFLAPECLRKVAETVQFLSRPVPQTATAAAATLVAGWGRVILCTGAVLEETARECMGGVKVTTFRPAHRAERLQNQFRCYVNFNSPTLPYAAPATASAAAASSNTASAAPKTANPKSAAS